MAVILFTTSDDSSNPQSLHGNFQTVQQVKDHILQSLGVKDVVLFKGNKFRIPLSDSDLIQPLILKPVKVPTVFHAELIR